MSRLPYRRILLKLSGEMLMNGDEPFSVDAANHVVSEIVAVRKLGVEVVVVLGAGNFWRARDFGHSGIERVQSDTIGMLGTLMNGLALAGMCAAQGIKANVLAPHVDFTVAEPFNAARAVGLLERGEVVFCAGGTGNPYFTTDTAAALRALETKCDVLLKATKVDGVYDADPKKNAKAKRYTKISMTDVLAKNLQVMDSAAISLCREGKLPIVVFDFLKTGSLQKILKGASLGTIVTP